VSKTFKRLAAQLLLLHLCICCPLHCQGHRASMFHGNNVTYAKLSCAQRSMLLAINRARACFPHSQRTTGGYASIPANGPCCISDCINPNPSNPHQQAGTCTSSMCQNVHIPCGVTRPSWRCWAQLEWGPISFGVSLRSSQCALGQPSAREACPAPAAGAKP
jgi:hypothetical protein